MPEFPSEVPDLIYLCFPNNPTGSAITKDELQKWVDYANKNGCVIIYDAAYELISLRKMYRTVFMSARVREHARLNFEAFQECRIYWCSSWIYGYSEGLVRDGVSLHSLWARRHGTKFNGAPYIVQKAGEAVYSEAGKAQLKDQVGYYNENAN